MGVDEERCRQDTIQPPLRSPLQRKVPKLPLQSPSPSPKSPGLILASNLQVPWGIPRSEADQVPRSMGWSAYLFAKS